MNLAHARKKEVGEREEEEEEFIISTLLEACRKFSCARVRDVTHCEDC